VRVSVCVCEREVFLEEEEEEGRLSAKTKTHLCVTVCHTGV
jgi:hypothetical protein